MTSGPRDDDQNVVLMGVSSIDLKTPVPIAVNPVTHAILVELV